MRSSGETLPLCCAGAETIRRLDMVADVEARDRLAAGRRQVQHRRLLPAPEDVHAAAQLQAPPRAMLPRGQQHGPALGAPAQRGRQLLHAANLDEAAPRRRLEHFTVSARRRQERPPHRLRRRPEVSREAGQPRDVLVRRQALQHLLEHVGRAREEELERARGCARSARRWRRCGPEQRLLLRSSRGRGCLDGGSGCTIAKSHATR